jgi:membrane-bound acyltransferase YfiQ involved in biofilm formation
VEIMKVFIVLVLLVVFAECEETTQELERYYKDCLNCIKGVQFARKNINMDLDVI